MPFKYNPYSGTLDYTMGPGSGTATVQFNTDGASAVPTGAGVITLAGGTGLTTSGAANTVTINLDTPVVVSNGGTGRATLTDASILIGDGTNPVEMIGPLTNGQLLIGSTGLSPVAASITAGSGIAVSNGAGSISIAVTGGGIAWNEIAGASSGMSADNGYVSSNAGLVTLTLPVTCAFGTILNIAGKGAGGWRIAQNVGQTINLGATPTTTGMGGRLDSTNRYDSIQLLCITANTDFVTLSVIGNITVT